MIFGDIAENHPRSWNRAGGVRQGSQRGWRGRGVSGAGGAGESAGGASLGGRAGHDRGEAATVRSAPVDPPAAGAPGELVVAAPGSWQQLLLDVAFGLRGEMPVAGEAPGPRRQRRSEPVEHVAELLVGAGSPHVGPKPQ